MPSGTCCACSIRKTVSNCAGSAGHIAGVVVIGAVGTVVRALNTLRASSHRIVTRSTYGAGTVVEPIADHTGATGSIGRVGGVSSGVDRTLRAAIRAVNARADASRRVLSCGAGNARAVAEAVIGGTISADLVARSSIEGAVDAVGWTARTGSITTGGSLVVSAGLAGAVNKSVSNLTAVAGGGIGGGVANSAALAVSAGKVSSNAALVVSAGSAGIISKSVVWHAAGAAVIGSRIAFTATG